MTIQAAYYDLSTRRSTALQREEVASLLVKSGILTWIDIDDPDADELSWLSKVVFLPQLPAGPLMYETLQWGVDYFAFTLNSVRFDAEKSVVEKQPVTIIVRPTYFVTVKYHAIGVLQTLRYQWQNGRLNERALAYCLYLIADSVMDTCLSVTNEIQARMDGIRELPRPGRMKEVFQLRAQLNELLGGLRPYRVVFHSLLRIVEGKSGFPLESTRRYYSYITQHLQGIKEEIYLCLDMLNGIAEENEDEQANQLNVLVSRLTLLGILLATFQVLVGMLSVNLGTLFPNLLPIFGILIMFGLLAGAALIEIFLFKKQGWLK